MGQVQAQHRVARLEHREVHRHVGLGPAVGLDIGVLGREQLLGPVAGQVLDGVHVHAAAVVAPARVALGVLVGEVAAHGREDGQGGVVLAGDQFKVLSLALDFQFDGLEHGWIC